MHRRKPRAVGSVAYTLCSVASVVSDSATLWTIDHQAPPLVGFSRQEYWSGLPCRPPGDLSDPGIKPACLMSSALAGGFFFNFILFLNFTILY